MSTARLGSRDTAGARRSAVRPSRWGRSRPVARLIRRAYRVHLAGVVSLATALLGIAAVLAGLAPDQRERLHDLTPIVPFPATTSAAAVSAVAGLLLLRVAAGLRRGKRRAWQLAAAGALALLIAYLIRGQVAESAVAAGLVAVLWAARTRFTAKPDPVTRWFAVRVLAQSLLLTTLAGMAALYLYPDQVDGSPPFWTRLQEVLYGLVGAHGPLVLADERFSAVLHVALMTATLLSAAAATLLALRAPEPVAPLTVSDERRVRALLARHGGRDSLGYFATRRDKSVVWSTSGKAAIGYRVVNGVALISGDPVGDPEAWPGAIAEYDRLVTEHAWTPAVMGCSELAATVFRRELGLSVLELGDEAIVEVSDFCLEGRAKRGVRQACGRVERLGYTASIRRAAVIDAEEFAQLGSAAQRWRGTGAERGFSMALSRLGDDADGDCVLVTAHRDGQLWAVLHFVPWGRDGLSLDLMRRERNADNGLNEFLITQLVRACPELGVRRLSLNFAVFRDALERGERIGAGPILRAWRRLLLIASRWWQIESLYRFNAKFGPTWQPRYLSYPHSRDLPRIIVAALQAEAFLIRPRRLARWLKRPEV